MTLPTIVPSKYTATARDFLLCKADKSGAMRLEPFPSSVPSGTVVTTIVGLVPFRKGARLSLEATSITSDALGTSVTGSVGVIYNDNTNNANIPALFASGLTTFAAGGNLTLIKTPTTEQWFATDDGWIAVTLAGATTGTTNPIHGQIVLSYDPML